MKHIKPTQNKHNWPRNKVETVEARKRDLIIRIADWTRTKDEPAFDVEVYIGGVYDFNESKIFSVRNFANKEAARQAAANFASSQTLKLL